MVIRGVGAVSALGPNVAALRDALWAGRDGIAPITRFDVAPFEPVHLGGCVSAGESCVEWAVAAALEAWRDAGLEGHAVAPDRIAVVAGTTEGEGSDLPGIARAVAAAIGAEGAQWTVSTACTSSANALGLGKDLLDRGDADVVLAGGAERLLPEMFAGFFRLGVLATDACAPFGATRGTTLGEGAGFVVLERAERRDGPVRAYLHGYGLGSDAWHETTPEPRGGGIERASKGALGDAGLAASAIDYVNAHGTGTPANDDSEWRGIRAALGARAEAIPVSASKSFLAHAQGAAGVLELIATFCCVEQGSLPPTLRVGEGRPNGPPDPIGQGSPRAARVTRWLSNSSAFGGANAVLCLGTEPAPATDAGPRVARVVGLGRVRFEADEPRDEARLARGVGVDLLDTDPSGRLCVAAASRALADASIRIRGGLRERAGIFAGATRVSPTSLAEYRDSIERHGLGRCSAVAFSRLVLHAPAGATSRLLALRGPTTTLAAYGVGGLLAFGYAADTIRRRRDADVMLALGFDERAELEESEGAACAVIAADADAGPCVVGFATAGPDALEAAIDAALTRAGATRDAVASWHRLDGVGPAPSLSSASLALEAAVAVREGARYAVAAAADDSVSCAVVLAPNPGRMKTHG
ncbi:MAG: hypothetical protein H6719_33585 [Sandaracinaceae bacterium]|nr:hypothetical protein [Sandaracinaceae bacterium]